MDRNNGKLCQDALIGGAADLANLAEAPLTYLAAQNPHVKILAVHELSDITRIVARTDKGIVTPQDLKGKKIGVLPGTASFFFLYDFLEKNGMSLADVHPVTLQVQAMPPALRGGQVDAVAIWQPWAYQAVQAVGEDQAVQFYDGDAYSWHGILEASDKTIAAKGPQIEDFLKALVETEAFMAANPQEAKDILEKRLEWPRAIVEDVWAHSIHRTFLDDSTAALMAKNFKILQETQEDFADRPLPDFSVYPYPAFLREVAPDRVNLP